MISWSFDSAFFFFLFSFRFVFSVFFFGFILSHRNSLATSSLSMSINCFLILILIRPMSASSSRHAPSLPLPTTPPVQVQHGVKRRRPRNTPQVHEARDTNIADQSAIGAFFFYSLSLSPSQRPSFLPMNLLPDTRCCCASPTEPVSVMCVSMLGRRRRGCFKVSVRLGQRCDFLLPLYVNRVCAG